MAAAAAAAGGGGGGVLKTESPRGAASFGIASEFAEAPPRVALRKPRIAAPAWRPFRDNPPHRKASEKEAIRRRTGTLVRGMPGGGKGLTEEPDYGPPDDPVENYVTLLAHRRKAKGSGGGGADVKAKSLLESMRVAVNDRLELLILGSLHLPDSSRPRCRLCRQRRRHEAAELTG